MLRVMQKILMSTDSQSVLIRKHLEIVKKKKKKKLEGFFFSKQPLAHQLEIFLCPVYLILNDHYSHWYVHPQVIKDKHNFKDL